MIPCILCFSLFHSYIYIPLSVKVIGGELQERLIPVPYSKNTTDQAVSSSCFHFPFPFFFKLNYLKKNSQVISNQTERKMHQLVAFSLVTTLTYILFSFPFSCLYIIHLYISNSKKKTIFFKRTF